MNRSAVSIGVISAGAWGTAIAKTLAENGHHITIWDHLESVVEDINTSHVNSKYLPDVALPENLSATITLEDAVEGKEHLFIATPSLYLESLLNRLTSLPAIREGRPIITLLGKGFISTERGPSLIPMRAEHLLPDCYENKTVYLSGPSHAEEVASHKVTGLISASRSGRNSIRVRKVLTSASLLIFSSLDVVGVATCAAVKNVVAIAFGIMDAVSQLSDRFGDNTESLLLAAGLNEIRAIGKLLGSTHSETFTSIAGVGDLDVTCRSKYGRNRRLGLDIITKDILKDFSGIDDLIENMDKVGYLAEGVAAAKFVRDIAQNSGMNLPICRGVYDILNKEKAPVDSVTEMISALTGITRVERLLILPSKRFLSIQGTYE